MLIVRDSYINKFAQKAKLLAKWSLNSSISKQKATNKPKSCGKQKKKLNIFLQQDILFDLPQQNLDILINQITSQQTILLMTDIMNKIYKPLIYEEVINNTIHGKR